MPLTRLVQCAHMRWCGEVGVGGVRGHVFWGGRGASLVRRATTARCVRIKNGSGPCPGGPCMPLTRLVQCAHMRWCGEVGVGGVRGHVFGVGLGVVLRWCADTPPRGACE
jgi:hypothetical protein